ncbi:hypothetical protein [Kutzneria sp. NPDC051319]|uniref:hypothetical protein n=1 Tax=Kutzneria sp. NPDC051319 TaxID=3155047 RepID=UPI003439EDBA
MRKLALLLVFPLLLAMGATANAATGAVDFTGGTHYELSSTWYPIIYIVAVKLG